MKTKSKKRGWDALEEKLKKRGLSKVEIEEARGSFYKGIQLLAELFLKDYKVEKRKSRRGELDKT